MLIDLFLPDYDFSEKHETIVRAGAEKAYAAIGSVNFTESWLIWGLLGLRGLGRSPSKTLTVRDLTADGFAVLGEKPDEELLLGLAGKFWTLGGCLQNINAENFRQFQTKGYAKTVWNFTVMETAENEVRVGTETRVKCLDEESLASFGFYWRFVRPFSGLIRREMLRLVKQKAESENKTSDWRDLARKGKFIEAESAMLGETGQETAYGYETLTRAGFYEDWGDRAEDKREAGEHYEKALDGYRLFASWAPVLAKVSSA